MVAKKKAPAKKNKVVSSVKNAVKDALKKEKAKVEELKAISQKAESKVEELKKASRKAKDKVKSKVEEIKKSVSKTATAKRSTVKKSETPVATERKSAAAKTVEKPKNVSASGTARPEKADALAVTSEFSPEYLVLMQRDPNFLHAFWDVKEERLQRALRGNKSLVLRLYDVSSDLTVRKNKKRKFRDVEIPKDAKSWYVQNRKEVSFSATLGTKTSAGKFEPLVEAPAMQVFSYENVKHSDLKTDDVFFKASLGGAGIGGFGSSGLSSSSVAKWLEHLASSSESFFSGALSSASSLSSGSLLEQPTPGAVNYGKDFFLWVKTRLIVYGGTRPDAHLQVRGEPFPLNPDGTFSFEQDLPDSTQIIPVFATDKDGDFPTTIVPVVIKRTE